MPRRFQFSLRALLTVMLAVAVACAIWVRLPVTVKVAIIGVPLGILMWPNDCFGFEIIEALLPPYGDPPKQNGPRYVIKWRRPDEKESRE
jgi:hypothetical protein